MRINGNLIDLRRIKYRQFVKKNSIVFRDQDVDITVSLFVFKEGDTFIAYCPSLDLSGYDYTADGACSDFEYMLTDYLNHQLENGTLRADLVSHGWICDEAKGREPELSDMLASNSQLKRLVAQPYSKTNFNKSCHIPS